MSMSTAPKPYKSTCMSTVTAQGRTVAALYQVIDRSDGEAVIETFRNPVLAERLAETSPAYAVREYLMPQR